MEMMKKNLLLKKKVKPIEDFIHLTYNPGSNKQTAELLHEYFELPIIDRTDTKLAAVGGKTLKKHLNNLIRDYNITEEELL